MERKLRYESIVRPFGKKRMMRSNAPKVRRREEKEDTDIEGQDMLKYLGLASPTVQSRVGTPEINQE